MKKIIFSIIAMSVSIAGYAQTMNLDLSPITSSLRTYIPDIVNIVCLVLLIIAVAGVAYKYRNETHEMWVGFIVSFISVFVVWGAARIAVNAFL